MLIKTQLKQVLQFFLLKITIGLVVIGGAIVLVEWAGQSMLKAMQLNAAITNLLIALAQAIVAIVFYKLLFRIYEQRDIRELSPDTFSKYAIMGFATGLILQTSFIVVIYLAGGYSIIRSNPFSAMLPAFTAALSAGFVAELLIRGIFFRILEEKFGTTITIIGMTILFGFLHSRALDANPVSVMATAAQAGFLLSAAYVLTRNLWFTIFIHFAWDFTEPGIFGAINPGNTITDSLFTSTITGPVILTGGAAGPQNAVPAILFCMALGSLFLWMAERNGDFLQPYWKN